jgi:uncharacterized protein YpmB
MKKIAFLLIIIFSLFLFGCTTISPEQIAMYNSNVKQFLDEYPDADITINLYSAENVDYLREILPECMIVGDNDYYLVEVNDVKSNLRLKVLIHKDSQTTVCARQQGIEQTETGDDVKDDDLNDQVDDVPNGESFDYLVDAEPFGIINVSKLDEQNFFEVTIKNNTNTVLAVRGIKFDRSSASINLILEKGETFTFRDNKYYGECINKKFIIPKEEIEILYDSPNIQGRKQVFQKDLIGNCVPNDFDEDAQLHCIYENGVAQGYPDTIQGATYDCCKASLEDGPCQEKGKYLSKAFCDGVTPSRELIECEYMCENGVCIDGPEEKIILLIGELSLGEQVVFDNLKPTITHETISDLNQNIELSDYDLIFINQSQTSKIIPSYFGNEIQKYVNTGGKIIIIQNSGIYSNDLNETIGWSANFGNTMPVECVLDINQQPACAENQEINIVGRIRRQDENHKIMQGFEVVPVQGQAPYNLTVFEVQTSDSSKAIAYISSEDTPKTYVGIVEKQVFPFGKIVYFNYDSGLTPGILQNTINYLLE